MRVHSGVTRDLVDPSDSPFWPAKPQIGTSDGPTALPEHDSPPRCSSVAGPRHRVHGMRGSYAAALGAVLAGCAVMSPDPWRVQGSYRIEHKGGMPAPGYLALARQYEGESRHALALQAYRKAAHEAPDDPDVMNAYGTALAERAQFAAAVVALRHAVALAPDRAPHRNNLGFALWLDGQTDAAREEFQQALRIDPGHALARRNLARAGAVAQQGTVAAVDATPEATGVMTAPAGPAAQPTSAPAPMDLRTAPTVPAIPVADIATLRPQVESATSMRAAALEPGTTTGEGARATGQMVRAIETRRVVPTVLATIADRIEISNGNGVNGMAAWLGSWLQARHVVGPIRLTNQPRFDREHTVVRHGPGLASRAQHVAALLPGTVGIEAVAAPLPRGDLQIVIGHDFRAVANCDRHCALPGKQRLTATRVAVRP